MNILNPSLCCSEMRSLHRLRDQLSIEDQMYRDEAVALEPTTLDRMAAGRQLLKKLRDRKEKARQELVKQKYLQQAWLVNAYTLN
jgi:hypothetical protein